MHLPAASLSANPRFTLTTENAGKGSETLTRYCDKEYTVKGKHSHNMGDYAAKGHDLVKKAEKKLNSFGLFGGFGNKYEDAADMLEKAGNQFKLAKSCEGLLHLS